MEAERIKAKGQNVAVERNVGAGGIPENLNVPSAQKTLPKELQNVIKKSKKSKKAQRP